jgi:hypothetical protein
MDQGTPISAKTTTATVVIAVNAAKQAAIGAGSRNVDARDAVEPAWASN